MRPARDANTPSHCFAKWLGANTPPLVLVACAFGCSLLLDPSGTQCSSDRQCTALVTNGQEARCMAGYCRLLGPGSSGGRSTGASVTGGTRAGNASEAGASDENGGSEGISGAPSVTATGGTNEDTGGRSSSGGSAGGVSSGGGSGGKDTGAGGLGALGGSVGTTGNAAGQSSGAAGEPASLGGAGAMSLGGVGGMATGGGGMSGMSGVGGTAIGGSAGGSGGIASTGGAGGRQTGTGGSPGSTSAKGVEVLSVPLSAFGQGQRYNSRKTTVLTPYDLAGARLTLRAYAPGATGGNLHVFYTSANFADSASIDVALTKLTSGFQNVDIPVPKSVSGGFQASAIISIRVEVEAGTGFGNTWQVPATVVYIDSIVSSNGVISDTFDAAPDADAFGLSDTREVPSSTLTWLAAFPVP